MCGLVYMKGEHVYLPRPMIKRPYFIDVDLEFASDLAQKVHAIVLGKRIATVHDHIETCSIRRRVTRKVKEGALEFVHLSFATKDPVSAR